MKKKIVILYSGGLDSFIMYKMAKAMKPVADVICLFIAHGQESEAVEIQHLPSFVIQKHLDWLGDEIKPRSKKSDPFAGDIYIPGRNLVFVSIAAAEYIPDEIWMGTTFDEDNETATDKNEIFRSKTTELLSYVLSPFNPDGIKVKFPFVDLKMTKVDSVRMAIKNSFVNNIELIENTTSCWHRKLGKLPCGVCKQCVKRNLVFRINGFHEEYEQDPIYSVEARKLINSYVNKTENLTKDEENMKYMIKKVIGL